MPTSAIRRSAHFRFTEQDPRPLSARVGSTGLDSPSAKRGGAYGLAQLIKAVWAKSSTFTIVLQRFMPSKKFRRMTPDRQGCRRLRRPGNLAGNANRPCRSTLYAEPPSRACWSSAAGARRGAGSTAQLATGTWKFISIGELKSGRVAGCVATLKRKSPGPAYDYQHRPEDASAAAGSGAGQHGSADDADLRLFPESADAELVENGIVMHEIPTTPLDERERAAVDGLLRRDQNTC